MGDGPAFFIFRPPTHTCEDLLSGRPFSSAVPHTAVPISVPRTAESGSVPCTAEPDSVRLMASPGF